MEKRKIFLKVNSSFLFLVILIFLSAGYALAVDYIKNFSNFPAYPYNTSAYKQNGAFVGCGPTTGAMILGYFDHVHNSQLLDNPTTGVNEGLNTAWLLHSSQYMNTKADGLGSVYDIEPGMENYALDKGYRIKVTVHVSPTYNASNAPSWLRNYGSFGDSWLNDGDFWYKDASGNWNIDANKFCDFVKSKITAGITIFLTIDSNGDGSGDHWVPLVGIDKAASKYYFYDTYSTTIKSALVRYCGAVSQVNSISFVRSVSYEGPINQMPPPTNLIALGKYKNSIPLAWKAPIALSYSVGTEAATSLLSVNPDVENVQNSQMNFPLEAEEKFMQKTVREPHSSPLAPTGYNVYRSETSNGNYVKIASNISRQYYRDNTVVNGQVYYYKVKAVYSTGESDFSNMASASSLSNGYFINSGWTSSTPTLDGRINSSEWADAETVDIHYPGKSGTVTLYVMNNGSKLFLAVDDKRDTQLDNLDQFAIFFDKNLDREFPASAPSGEGNFWIAWDAASGSSFSLFGPRYGYWPDHLNWEPRIVPPGVNHGMSASAGNVQYEGSFDLTNSPLTIAPGGTFGMLVFVYDKNAMDFDAFWPQQAVRLKRITPDIQTWGQAPFSYGDVRLASSGPVAPAAPSNLVAIAASKSTINLTWQDNSNDETGFGVERRKGTSGSWTLIGTCSPDETTFQSTGLEANTTYYYRVYAYKNSLKSSYSNVAQATTFPDENSVTVTAPNASGSAGSIVDVPITVSDVTGMGILSFTITIETNPDVIVPIGMVTAGTMIEGWGNVVSNINSGQILISGASTSPLSGSGTLLIVQYQVNAAASSNQTTSIHFVNAVFNEGTPSASTVDGLFTVIAGYDISGKVEYYSNSRPISEVNLTLGNEIAQTGNDGTFTFSMIPGGDYDLVPSKSGDLRNGISAFDASQVLLYSVGLTNLDPYQMIAADVSGNGSVTSYDASYILRYTVGLIESFPVGEEWRFVPKDHNLDDSNWNSAPDRISYAPLSSNMSDQNFVGILYGDVTGNWALRNLGKSSKAGNAGISFGEINSTEKERFDIPVIAKISGDLYSSKMNFLFDPKITIFKGIVLSEFMKDFSVVYRQENGNLHIALASAEPVNGELELFRLQFEILDRESVSAGVLELSDALVNEGQIAVDIYGGEILLSPQLPKKHELQQNYPNPFNPTTTIEYSLSAQANVRVTVFDVNGKQVRQLVNGIKTAGRHSVLWDARDDSGKMVSSGVYFYRLEVKSTNGSTSSFVKVRKMILMK